MNRWLAIVCLLAAPASAQVFKPKSGTSGSGSSTTTSSTPSKSSKAKKASTSTGKKSSARKTSSKKKKSTVASKGRPDDLTPDDAPKVDPDYVKIIDDDDE
ncbi:MAG: hypothetical protein JO257_21275 [Deltaproteobacteria bacterium]|nr:hypothetical protein [Deltaproteobacteria bacterium]